MPDWIPLRLRRTRRSALLVPAVLVAAAVATASWAAPVEPIPVKDDPNVVETAPAARGPWFGWAQNSQQDPDHYDFYVQRGTEDPVKVNAANTQGLGGDFAGRDVFYVQQFGDRDPRINRFDLKSGLRSALPAKVNNYRHTVKHYFGNGHKGNRVISGVRGDLTVSGPWLLYSGYMEFLDYDVYRYDTLMLYNRVTHRLRQIAAVSSDYLHLSAGQVNGKYVTYLKKTSYGTGTGDKSVPYRYNIKTGREVKLASARKSFSWGPSVSSDGTVYYFKSDDCTTAPCAFDLVRRPIGGHAEVIATLTTQNAPRRTYVKDRPDGSRLVFAGSYPGNGTYYLPGDIYKVVDDPETTAASR
jgi:hypothetical protein